MSTSLLYHAFGVKGYRQSAIRFEEGAVIFRIEQPRENLSCSACGSEGVFAKGAVTRRFRSVPIGSKAVWIEFAVPRVRCCRCGLERQVLVPFAEPKKTYTKSFARYVLELSSHMTIQGVAQHLNVGWDLVKQIQKQNLQRHFSQPKLRDLKRIAIDEIYIGKKHKYLTRYWISIAGPSCMSAREKVRRH